VFILPEAPLEGIKRRKIAFDRHQLAELMQ
jgi:hypothetical protein